MLDEETKRGDAAAIITAAEKWQEPQQIEVVQPDGVEGQPLSLLTVPRGVDVRDFTSEVEMLREAPRRRKGTAQLTTLQSLIDHANRFKDEASALFCDESVPSLTCVIDYHEGPSGFPRWGRHRGQYRFPLSDEWKAWTSFAREGMTQADFAEFLEEHIEDVIHPSAEGAAESLTQLGMKLATASDLLALSRGLTIRKNSKVANHKNLSTGEVQLQYAEEHTDEAGAPLRVPGGFVIAIPVFRRGPLYKLPVRLRYRERSGAVTWSLQIHQADRAFRNNLEESCLVATEQTGLPLFYGTPE